MTAPEHAPAISPAQTLPLPPGLHPDTLAVRASVPRSGYGEHST